MPVAEVAIALTASGTLKTTSVGVEPEFVGPLCDALLDLVDRLQQFQEEARIRELRPSAAILSLPLRR